MNKCPNGFKPLTEEQLPAVSAKYRRAERAVEPEEVGITEEMMRKAQAASQSSAPNGPQKLDALRAFLGTTTNAEASASMATQDTGSTGNWDGYGEDPTPLDDFVREQDERRFLEQRDASVTDSELVARMNSAPDMGGAVIAAHMKRTSPDPRKDDVRSLKPTAPMVEAKKAPK